MDRSRRPKGPGYLIIDNFEDTVKDLEKADLLKTRSEAELWTDSRRDNLIWFKNLDDHTYNATGFQKIAKAMAAFRQTLNQFSQAESGDKTLRVDEEEIVLSRQNGGQKYERHRDSYYSDSNNHNYGPAGRKISMIIFLNDNVDEAQSKGMLRLYPNGERVDGVVDISPRLGRAVLFRSEEMLH